MEVAYRLLLRLHPRGFRGRYAEELVQCFRDGWADGVRGRGLLAAVGFGARILAGTLSTALEQRFSQAIHGGGSEMGTMMDSIRQNLRGAGRALIRRPGWAAVVILTLGLGMGATTAVFSVLHTVLLAPLPYADGERLVRVYLRNVVNGSDQLYLSAPAAAELRDRTTTLEAVALLENHNVEGATLADGRVPMRVRLLRVNAEYFDVLGVTPSLGRSFQRQEETPETRVAVVTERLWQETLGADPRSLGRSITLDEEAYRVVGVVPTSTRDPLSGPVDVWLPADLEGAAARTWEDNYLSAYAKLADGTTVERLRTELDRLAALHRSTEEAAAEKAFTAVPLKEDLVGDVRPLLEALMGAVALLFLLTCTNVASLLLARAATREQEFAIRAALGSRRRHLLTRAFVETTLVAIGGGAAGLLLGALALDSLLALAPLDLPLREAITLGSTPVGFAVALSVTVAMALGVVVAVPYATGTPHRVLLVGGRASRGGVLARRTRDALVIVDVAFAVILLIGAGVLVRTLEALRGRDLGVDPGGVVAFQVDLPETRYAAPDARIRFQDDLLDRLAGIPGVEAVGSVSHLPVTGSHNTWGTRPANAAGQGADIDNIAANQRVVDEGYFDVVGITLLAGRGLDHLDVDAEVPSVIVNRAAARTLFGAADPVGRRLAVGPLRPVIVGVVEDVALGARLGTAPIVYHAYDQFGSHRRWPQFHVVRIAVGAQAPWAAIRAALGAVDPELVLYGTVRLDDVVGQDIAGERFASLLLRGFAALGVLLAALGLFGVLAHAVQRQRHEIGIRIALGAASTDVRRRVLGRGLLLSLAGTGAGLGGAYALSRGLEFLVYGVSARDPLVFIGAPLVVLMVTLASGWLPARRATSVDPLELLRTE